MLTWRFAVHLNRSLVGLLDIVIEKTDVAYLSSFPCIVVKKTFEVTCGDPETEVDLVLSRAGIFETPKDGRGKGRFKSILKADWGIDKRVPEIVRKTSGKLIIPPCAKLRVPSDLGLDWELVNTHPVSN